MATIKLTSKRQATFPVEVCRELGIGSGDSVELEPLRHGNETVWILKPVTKTGSEWMASLGKYARNAKTPWSREEHGDSAARAMAEEAGK